MRSASDSTHVLSEHTAASNPMLYKADLIRHTLARIYPSPPDGFLHHTNPFTLLIAVLLSAQSLDSKVNQVTPHLFQLADTPYKMHALGEHKIRSLIKQIGLAPQKARNICKLSHAICTHFDGQVPDTFDGLESLAGVGHKTASVVMMQAFGKPAFPVDTHIHRLACRWGCGDPKSVDRTEAALKRWFPDPNTWGRLHVRMILFGRQYCPARKHDMDQCPVCCFAATDESRRANDIHTNKFVAAVRHRNPYSVREVGAAVGRGMGGDESGVEEYVPESVRKRTRTSGAKTGRRGAKVKHGARVAPRHAVDAGSGGGGGGEAGAVVPEGGKAVPTRKSTRLRKKRAADVGALGTEGGEVGGKKRKGSSLRASRQAGGNGRAGENVTDDNGRLEGDTEGV